MTILYYAQKFLYVAIATYWVFFTVIQKIIVKKNIGSIKFLPIFFMHFIQDGKTKHSQDIDIMISSLGTYHRGCNA